MAVCDPWAVAHHQPSSPAPTWLRATDGTVLPLSVERWRSAVGRPEREVLERVRPSVLDVGCGPGRILDELCRREVPAVGIDTSAAAVSTARRGGATVWHQSIFDHLPAEGSWGSVLLLDDNLGIGGDPVALLGRVASVLAPGAPLVAEMAAPECPSRSVLVRVERGASSSRWFPWSVVSATDIHAVAEPAGLVVVDRWTCEGRWFAELRQELGHPLGEGDLCPEAEDPGRPFGTGDDVADVTEPVAPGGAGPRRTGA